MIKKIKNYFKKFLSENISAIKKIDFSKYFTNPKYLIAFSACLILLISVCLNMGLLRFIEGAVLLGIFAFVFLWEKG